MINSDFYLENMPIAFCAVEVLTDEEGGPVDLKIVYSNKAHARLEGYPHGELTGKRYLEIHKSIGQDALSRCYDTAYRGAEHTFNEYIQDRDRHLMIYIYPLEKGICGCLMPDVTELRREELKLLHEQERGKILLESTTEIVFEYDFKNRILMFAHGGNARQESRVVEGCPEGLVRKGLIREQYLSVIEEAYQELKEGRKAVEFNLQARLDADGSERWYTVSCSRYTERYTGHTRIVGYLRNVEQIVRVQDALKKEAMYDPLVELYNVKAGKEMVTEELDRAEDGEINMMFLMDLDDFKQINDTYGHQTGDEFLKRFARILSSSFRKSDILYRMGGDEFIGFTPNVAKPDQAVERIMERLYGRIKSEGEKGYRLQCSVGIFVSSRKRSYSYFYKMADRALYEAKRSGKNNYKIIREL